MIFVICNLSYADISSSGSSNSTAASEENKEIGIIQKIEDKIKEIKGPLCSISFLYLRRA